MPPGSGWHCGKRYHGEVPQVRTGAHRRRPGRLLPGRRRHLRHLPRHRPDGTEGQPDRSTRLRALPLNAHESFGDYLWRLLSGSLAPSLYARRVGGFSITDATLVTLSAGRMDGLHRPAHRRSARLSVGLAPALDAPRRGALRVPGGEPAHRLGRSEAGLLPRLQVGHLPALGLCELLRRPDPMGVSPDPPAFVLCLPFAAIYTRVVRASLRNVRRARAGAPPEERDGQSAPLAARG